MKSLIAFSVLLFISLNSYEQQKYLGSTRKEIAELFKGSGKLTNGEIYDIYDLNRPNSMNMQVIYFFNADNRLTHNREYFRKRYLIQYIEKLNKSYIKVDDSKWVSKDNSIKIELSIHDEKDMVIVDYSPI